MSALFLKTADNEKEHAKMWFKELAGIGDTKENQMCIRDRTGIIEVNNLNLETILIRRTNDK